MRSLYDDNQERRNQVCSISASSDSPTTLRPHRWDILMGLCINDLF